jgi:hypothetical protein
MISKREKYKLLKEVWEPYLDIYLIMSKKYVFEKER